MPNMQKTKTPMPAQDPSARARNWYEVALGYTAEDMASEAARCLNCKNHPCTAGCPVSVNIPGFIKKLAEGKPTEALRVIEETSSLAAICGRVCPQERQCESLCVRGKSGDPVGIGRLERYAADHGVSGIQAAAKESDNGTRVAVIGSGPAGLSCASDLRRMGYGVTVFEALHKAGGVLSYGIPEFRLPKSIVGKQIEALKEMGVEFRLDSVVGRTFTVDELFEKGYEAVFIGSGAGLPGFMGVPGENAAGVMSANEFLTRINLMKAYREEYDTPIRIPKKAAVVGGGNVAMDAARCAMRLGAEEVSVIYRRSEAEMPARAEEIEHAKEEGVIFRTLQNPVRVNTDEKGSAVSVTVVDMELGEPGPDGRRRPVEKKGSEHDVPCDTLIVAVGTSPNPLLRMTTPGLEADRKGCLTVLGDGVTTTRPGVFAGGDAVSGAATVILAMGAGKTAAKAIDGYIKSKAK